MANQTTAAGDQGVAGTLAGGLGNRPGGAFDGDMDGNFTITGNEAVRFSVAMTQGGVWDGDSQSSTRSSVFSYTQGLRFAYPTVEADTPAVTRS
jgi:hypothetical protein